MANLDLSKYGIQDVKEILHNPSYEVLYCSKKKPNQASKAMRRVR